MKRALASIVLAAAASLVQATEFLYIPNMSLVKWQMASNGVVYFRNLNEFHAGWLGCCYNFWLDTTTSAGKSAWASILLKSAGSLPLWFAASDPNAPGAITYVGIW